MKGIKKNTKIDAICSHQNAITRCSFYGWPSLCFLSDDIQKHASFAFISPPEGFIHDLLSKGLLIVVPIIEPSERKGVRRGTRHAGLINLRRISSVDTPPENTCLEVIIAAGGGGVKIEL